MNSNAKLKNDFFVNLIKIAGKNKVSRKKIIKSLEKSKSDYAKAKSEADKLGREIERLQKSFDKFQAECSLHKKEMIKYHKIVQKMDLSGATDTVFYKDQDDIAYVIDGKEYDLSLDDDGDMTRTPWRAARRARRAEPPTDEVEVSALADDGADGDFESQDDEESFNFSSEEDEISDLDKEVDDLYNKLMS